MKTPITFIGLLVSVLINAAASAQDRVASLRTGRTGIAAEYPEDRGIDRHPDVVFSESFDDDIGSVKGRWESVANESALSLSNDTPVARDGSKSLLVTHVGGKSTGAHLYKRLHGGFEKLHYRFYVKFDRDCAPIHHFFHVGGYHPSTAWPQGGAGTRPRGDERFTTGVEPFGESWRWDYYSYWMKMRGSPPRGQCWGNSFIHDPAAAVTKGRWQCLELMMKTNDTGKSNGEMALWLDGELLSHLRQGAPAGKWVFDKFLPGQGGEGVRWNDDRGGPEPLNFPETGEPFEGFEWRSDEELKLNFVWLLCYITKSPRDHVSKIWFDDIVIANSYIGPIQNDLRPKTDPPE